MNSSGKSRTSQPAKDFLIFFLLLAYIYFPVEGHLQKKMIDWAIL